MQEKQGDYGHRKRKRRHSLPVLMAVALFALYLSLSAVSVAGSAEKNGTLTVQYLDLDGEAVEGAEFTLRLVAEPVWDGSYRSLLPLKIDAETEPAEIAALAKKLPARTFATAKDGVGRIGELDEGLYLVEETSPAEGYFASVPFFVTIPSMRDGGWNYDVLAEPKPLAAGALRIKKTVTGEGGEKDREFSFRIRIDADGEFPVSYSSGEEDTIKTGGTVVLRHGETATVSMLPAGTSYEVREIEADEDGYRTSASGEKGNIEAKETAEAAFVNDRGITPTPSTPPTPSSPPYRPPQTGDTANAKLFVLLGLGAVVALAAVLFGRRRRGRGKRFS